ncbi:MAG TPA: response regulator transcription factor [Terriglobales bacterium]|nr:response regulator transcription factor [Terriglobales bacterium]
MRVLIVEDERKMADVLKKGLEEQGHSVTLAHTGTEGLALAETLSFEAMVLDIMLPGLDGFEVARRLRKADDGIPILILTARDGEADLVKALNLGADDYLTKPFSFVEFVARLHAISRRASALRSSKLKTADLVLDPSTHEVYRGDERISLTRKEYLLLELLLRNAGRVLRRETIINTVWGTHEEVENNTLDVFIKHLRNKVDDGYNVKLIHTVRGFGYRLHEGEA